MQEAWRRYWAPLFSASADHRVVATAKRMALAQSPEAVARGITAFHSRRSRIDFLARFSRPVIVVAGADDTAPGLKTSAAQSEAAPLGSLHILTGCGHYVPLERPGELNAILRTVIAAQYN